MKEYLDFSGDCKFLVAGHNGNIDRKRKHVYCATLEEAEKVAAEYRNEFAYVRIMYPGEWK